MKSLSRNEMKNLFGGKLAPNTPGTCKCLVGDPDGTCRKGGGMCECTSNGAPSSYSLNDASCTAIYEGN